MMPPPSLPPFPPEPLEAVPLLLPLDVAVPPLPDEVAPPPEAVPVDVEPPELDPLWPPLIYTQRGVVYSLRPHERERPGPGG